ncbi:hypothetical protein GWK47_052366 [Chionoecetes opilio]|uniref:Uncharacterized protein n=1 Tax=Chionoecetes opilio TaxID=41210 RepID=A0A8J4Y1E4_CHIOP|nr:hypothetical protein GWK47_052366 [Chionoecetes opilio]
MVPYSQMVGRGARFSPLAWNRRGEDGLADAYLPAPALRSASCRVSLMLDTVGGMAKAACGLPPNGNGPSPSLLCYRAGLRSDALLSTARSRDTQRGDSVSIQHYDVIRAHSYKYRRRGLMVRRHNVVSARLRLGYRPVWQVAGMAEEPHFTSCQLCDAPSSNTLAHYCLHCHVVRDMLPRGLPLTEICRFLLVHDNLDTILVRHPRFGGC